jgi:hypothetical protein
LDASNSDAHGRLLLVVGALSFGRAFIVQDAGVLETVPAHWRVLASGRKSDTLE